MRTREEINEALAQIREAVARHNEDATNFKVTDHPYEREFSDGSNIEVGLILKENGITFNSFDIILEALHKNLFCNSTSYTASYFGVIPGMQEGETIATVCGLTKERRIKYLHPLDPQQVDDLIRENNPVPEE